ncbi:hypothetical protein HDU82_007424 [Entophlyctis luteolus]|nr:hypothetical protein HDU82_007424 [Entophlyctis luteolus]
MKKYRRLLATVTALASIAAAIKVTANLISSGHIDTFIAVSDDVQTILNRSAGFFIRCSTTSDEDEVKWFASLASSALLHSPADNASGVLFVTSANAAVASGAVARNMLCSLATNAPRALAALVVWATDREAAVTLLALAHEFAGLRGGPPAFAVYYDATVSLPTDKGSYKASSRESFFKLMEARNAFFARLLNVVGIDFVFSDMDVAFLADPLADLNVPLGVPAAFADAAATREEGLVPLKELQTFLPAIVSASIACVAVYSTDTRDFFHNLNDPFERSPRIPKICGGFFFIRANNRTRTLWEYMRAQNLNDQWGMDQVLNGYIGTARNTDEALPRQLKEQQRVFDAVLVDPLPAGILKRKDARPKDALVDAQQTLRIRILSQAAYRAALPHYSDGGVVGDDYDVFVAELKVRGEKEVLFHPNYLAKFFDRCMLSFM